MWCRQFFAGITMEQHEYWQTQISKNFWFFHYNFFKLEYLYTISKLQEKINSLKFLFLVKIECIFMPTN